MAPACAIATLLSSLYPMFRSAHAAAFFASSVLLFPLSRATRGKMAPACAMATMLSLLTARLPGVMAAVDSAPKLRLSMAIRGVMAPARAISSLFSVWIASICSA